MSNHIPQLFYTRPLIEQYECIGLTAEDAMKMSLPGDLAASNPDEASPDSTKTNDSFNSSEGDSTENNQKKSNSLSPNQYNSSFCGDSSSTGSNTFQNESASTGSNNFSNNSPSDLSNNAVAKIISLIDQANEQFKEHKETLDKDRQEVEFLRTKLRSSLADEEKLRTQLEVERKRGSVYFRRYCKIRREVLELKETIQQTTDHHPE